MQAGRLVGIVSLVALVSVGFATFPHTVDGAGKSLCESLLDALQNDAGSGTDAGDTEQEATWIAKHEAYNGIVLPVTSFEAYQDTADVYRFYSPPGESILVNLTIVGVPEPALVLVDPQGNSHVVEGTRGASDPFGLDTAPSLVFTFQEEFVDAAEGIWLALVLADGVESPASAPCPTELDLDPDLPPLPDPPDVPGVDLPPVLGESASGPAAAAHGGHGGGHHGPDGRADHPVGLLPFDPGPGAGTHGPGDQGPMNYVFDACGCTPYCFD